MKRIFLLSLGLTLLLLSLSYAQQQRQLVLDNTTVSSNRRIALVIGNGAYVNVPRLRNSPNDATDMADALSKLGFNVEHGINLTQKQMKFMIREFGQKLRAGGQGLFYFAGHGVQLRGRNYLMPVDSNIQTETDVEDQGVDANLVLGLMDEANNGLNVVILDACRNNPFARSFRSASNGLAQMDAPSGTLIAYATAPGSVASDGNARNGLYTQELLKFMQAPGLNIENVFKQVRISVRNLTQGKQTPWESSSLVGDFYFNRVNAPNPQDPQTVNLPTKQTTAVVRYDGVYVRTFTYTSVSGSELIGKSYVKLYEDGTIRVLTLVGKASEETPNLKRLNTYGHIGSYVIEGSHIRFHFAQEAGAIEGSIENNGLALVLRNVGSRFKSVGGEFIFKRSDLR